MTWIDGSSLLPTVDLVTRRQKTLYQLLLFRSNCLSWFWICKKQYKLYGHVSYPGHNGLFVRVIMFQSHMALIKHWTFCIQILCSLFLFSVFYFVNTSMLLHTLTYQIEDPYPPWIPLIIVMLLPIMTSKIRSTKPRTEVRIIVKYLESLIGC